MYEFDLFWGNLPSKSTYLGFLSPDIYKTPLRDVHTPYFIWTGNGAIPKLLEKKFTDSEIDFLNEHSVAIYLFEPLLFRLHGDYNYAYYTELLDTDSCADISCDELDDIQTFINQNKLTNVNIYAVEYDIQKLKIDRYKNLNLQCFDLILRCTAYALQHPYKKNISYKFHCSNWRYTAHRHLIIAYVAGRNGIYSWYYRCSFNLLKQINWFNFNNVKVNYPDIYDRLVLSINYLDTNSLKSIDNVSAHKRVTSMKECYYPDHTESHNTLIDSYSRVFCAIITETRFAQPFSILSEKTLNPITEMCSFIIVGPPNSLEYLKQLGFKTFSKWWDESYDTELNHEKRMIKIFRLIDYIDSLSLKTLREMHNDMYETLAHNYNVVKSFKRNDIIL